MPIPGAKCEYVNTEGIDGDQSFAVLVADPRPYNVGIGVDGGR